MIRGEWTAEKLSPEVTSASAHDPLDDELLPWEDRKSDVEEDDKLSQYSSCGDDSEFDRYASANSVMGTPSLCSSVHEFPDSEYGSFKSFKLGGENRNFQNFCVDKKLSGESGGSYRGSDFCDGNMRNDEKLEEVFMGTTNKGLEFYGHSGSFFDNEEVGFMRNDTKNGGWSENREVPIMEDQNSLVNQGFEEGVKVGGHEENVVSIVISCDSFESEGKGGGSEAVSREIEEDFESHRDVELVDAGLGVDLLSELECHGIDVGRCSDEGETLSRHGHSEGEDSMFGCGSDDEKMPDSYYVNNVKYSRAEGHEKDENQLLMTSAVAFGSDDWDDFMQETGGIVVKMMVQDEFHGEKQEGDDHDGKTGYLDSTSAINVGHSGVSFKGQQEKLVDISRTNDQVHECESVQLLSSSSEPYNLLKFDEADQGGHVKDMHVKDNPVSNINGSTDYSESCLSCIKDEMDQNPLIEETPLENELKGCNIEVEEGHQEASIQKVTSISNDLDHESMELEKMNLLSKKPSDSMVHKLYPASGESIEDRKAEIVKENDAPLQSLLADKNTEGVMGNSPLVFDHFEDQFSPMKRENSEFGGFYDEMVHEMEEILLDTDESPGPRFNQDKRIYQSLIPMPSRDGGSTASTSCADDAYPLRIDGLEVVGARQKTGDVSFSERLVGVKEYTVYKIRIWTGEDSWEVERRYRDFFALYRQLKKLFADHGWILPPPWSSVEQESRKVFGNASPDVIAHRSVLIQDCLRSILQSKISPSSLTALMYFLSPSKTFPCSPRSVTSITPSPYSTKDSERDNFYMMGKTISLVVQIRRYKSMKQMLDAQHYTCAGCHKNFGDGKTRMKELVQALGWGKPRLCEYSGQLFCSTCHTNDTAVLPARVLHLWDFAQYPVSQLAKSYLDSIYDKPMLCVSAVNPFLFSKVPALQHVTNVRKKIGAMIPYVRCPFRRSIYKGLGYRRYLLESNDFFALRDLIDLSRGIFAALPVMVETVSSKILEHITEQCLVCCDAGIPCNARQACKDPSSLIFPFQEGEVERCRSCDTVFHRHCFAKIVTCQCDALLNPEEAKRSMTRLGHSIGGEANTSLRSLGKESDISPRFLSGLFSKLMPQRSPGHQEQGPKDGDPVILMGSLPTNSL